MLDKVEGAIKQTIQRNWMHWKAQSNRQSRETGCIGRCNQTDNSFATTMSILFLNIDSTSVQEIYCKLSANV
jgi:hypothetical protein